MAAHDRRKTVFPSKILLEVTDYDSSWVGKQLSFPVYSKLIIKKKKKSEITLNKFYLYSTDKQQSRHLLAIEKYVLSPVLKIDPLENEKYLQIR